jgi:mannosyltransferase
VLTIHDFVHEKFYKGLRKYLHIYQKKRAIKHARLIITVSENTKKDLLFYYPEVDSDNIKVVYNGVSDNFFRINGDIINKKDTFLFIGSREKYKNFHNIIKIISSINNFKIIIVGSKLKSLEIDFLNTYLKDRWTFYLHISNQDLNFLYNSVLALLYVSSYEGFGIPLLEAMKAGCPFIALNNSSIPEVAGNAGILIDELNLSEIKRAINYINMNREYIIIQGLDQVKNFSWEKCYTETMNLYHKLLDIK